MKIINQVSKNLQIIFMAAARECAEETGLIQRQGGKVTGENLCQTLVFGWWQNPDASLESLCQMGMTVGLDISPQGLEQRFTEKTSHFLKAVLSKVIEHQIAGDQTAIDTFKRFSAIYLDDSSSISLPEELVDTWNGLGTKKGATSAVKLQTRIDLTCGAIDGPHLVDARMHDRLASEQHPEIEANALLIPDLGYWLLDRWAAIELAGAYFLTRMKSQVQFFHQARWWTTFAWIRTLPATQRQFEVTALLGKRTKLKVRIMGKRVSTDTASERRRKLKRKYEKMGKTVSQTALTLCDWTILVTNAPEEKVSFEDAFILFRTRWQIELLFKLWKSEGKIDEWRSKNAWRCLCELYAKLIAMLLQQWCFTATIWSDPARSLTKASRTLRTHLIRLVVALPSKRSLAQVLTNLAKIMSGKQSINTRKSNPSLHQLLVNLQEQVS